MNPSTDNRQSLLHSVFLVPTIHPKTAFRLLKNSITNKKEPCVKYTRLFLCSEEAGSLPSRGMVAVASRYS